MFITWNQTTNICVVFLSALQYNNKECIYTYILHSNKLWRSETLKFITLFISYRYIFAVSLKYYIIYKCMEYIYTCKRSHKQIKCNTNFINHWCVDIQKYIRLWNNLSGLLIIYGYIMLYMNCMKICKIILHKIWSCLKGILNRYVVFKMHKTWLICDLCIYPFVFPDIKLYVTNCLSIAVICF